MNLIFRLIKIVHVITDLFNVSTNTNTHKHTHTPTHRNKCMYMCTLVRYCYCCWWCCGCGCYCCVVGIFVKTNKPYYHDGSMFFLLCAMWHLCARVSVCVCIFHIKLWAQLHDSFIFGQTLFSVLDFITRKQNTINIFLYNTVHTLNNSSAVVLY